MNKKRQVYWCIKTEFICAYNWKYLFSVLLQNETHVAAQKETKFRQFNQAIHSLAMAALGNREVTIIKPSVLRQWQQKPIEKSL
jgi:hypothetical protein